MASGRFNLGGIALAPYIADELIRKMNAQKSTDIELCDVGGGNGHLLQVATYLWTGSATSRLRLQRSRLKITMTTLYKHQPDLLDLRREIIDNLIIGTGIELPTNDLYNRFDILVAQNSVFFWSNYPELALTNLYKMCRPGGVVFATAPVGPITVAGKAEIYLVDVIPTSQLFVCDVLEVREEYAAFKLTKVIEPAAHTVR
jgi:SAM-dependent methyltransferase